MYGALRLPITEPYSWFSIRISTIGGETAPAFGTGTATNPIMTPATRWRSILRPFPI
jgi:hypothetical protein